MTFNRLMSWVFLAFMGVSSIFFYLCALVLRGLSWAFDRRLVLLHLLTSFWAYLYVWAMPLWKVTRMGREKIDKAKTYMVVSNHQSQLDILVAFGLFFHFKWVSKAAIFKVPLIGWNMVLNRYIKLKRGDKQSIKRMLDHCRQTLASGSSVFMFPEGSRSKDGRLRDFKPGAFMLAKEMGLHILPIAISGTAGALPKYSMDLQGKHFIDIEVLDEIPPSAFADLSVEDTAAMVRRVIAPHVREHNAA